MHLRNYEKSYPKNLHPSFFLHWKSYSLGKARKCDLISCARRCQIPFRIWSAACFFASLLNCQNGIYISLMSEKFCYFFTQSLFSSAHCVPFLSPPNVRLSPSFLLSFLSFLNKARIPSLFLLGSQYRHSRSCHCNYPDVKQLH